MPIKPLPAFFLSFSFLLFFPVLFPSLHLIFFAPFLVVIFYKNTFYSSLWKALMAGVIVDLFSFSVPFGMTSLNYILVSGVLAPQKRNLFADSLSTLPLMTFFFSFLSTLFSPFLLFFFGVSLPFSWNMLLADGLSLSLLDALFAFLFFSLPFPLLSKLTKMKRTKYEEE